MHFELYDMMSIIDGSQKCSKTTKTENMLEDDQKSFVCVVAEWRQDGCVDRECAESTGYEFGTDLQ